jgi:putative tricarboxylic transport membrane protein
VLLVLLVGYTEMAFELEWTTAAGRIGPGFFPRIIGILGSAICLGALLNSLRTGVVDDEDPLEDEVGEGDLGRHPGPLLLAIVAGALLLFTFLMLGAIVAGALFMFGMLAFLNPGRWLVNAVLSVAIPLGLYLLFQTALNAGLPEGILPRF